MQIYQQILSQNRRLRRLHRLLKNGRPIHEHVSVDPIVRNNLNDLILSEDELVWLQVRRQMILLYLSAK